jgi:hypothetical protein
MKVLVFIVFMLSGFALQAQERVCITPEASRFYLESVDQLDVYMTRDTIRQLLIENLRFTISTKNLLITNYESSNSTLKELVNLRKQETETYIEENKHLKKQIRKERLKTVLVAVGSGVLILLILI